MKCSYTLCDKQTEKGWFLMCGESKYFMLTVCLLRVISFFFGTFIASVQLTGISITLLIQNWEGEKKYKKKKTQKKTANLEHRLIQ